jgi:hypothetical protein
MVERRTLAEIRAGMAREPTDVRVKHVGGKPGRGAYVGKYDGPVGIDVRGKVSADPDDVYEGLGKALSGPGNPDDVYGAPLPKRKP